MMAPFRTVVVTGGAGFIGSHLVERLLGDGAGRVIVVDNFDSGKPENLAAVARDPRLSVVEGDCTDAALMAGLAKGASLIFHLASTVGVQAVTRRRMHTLASGSRGVLSVLDAAAADRVPVVFTSSSEVYGDSPTVPMREDARPGPGPSETDRWGYAAMKLYGEYCVLAQHRERSSPGMALRLFNTVGPRQAGRYGMVLPRFIAAARAGDPIPVYGDGTQTRCFGFVHDATEAILRLACNPDAFGRVINVGGTEEISILALAQLVKAETRSRSEIKLVPFSDVFGPGFEDVKRRIPDVTRLRRYAEMSLDTPIGDIVRATVASMEERSSTIMR